MSQSHIFFFASTFFALCGLQLAQPQNPAFVVTASRLPEAGRRHTAVYDGDDAVYLLGGHNNTVHFDQILKYSLSTGVVEAIGRYKGVTGGAAFMDGNADIFHMGGINPSGQVVSDVDKISTSSGNWYQLGYLPVAAGELHAAWDRARGVAHLFGGVASGVVYRRPIFKYDTSLDSFQEVGQLPEGRAAAGTAWDPENQIVYIFGGMPISLSEDILTFNPSTGAVNKLSTKLPYTMDYPTAMYANSSGNVQIFILDTEGLVSFDPDTQIAQRETVEAWPQYLDLPASVYVPKLGRIYIFGGYGSYNGETLKNRDEISYIRFTDFEGSTTETELPSTTLPPITTELPPNPTEAPFCPPSGVHNFPYPGNCTLYIRCFDGDAQVLSCTPLLFDSIDLRCKPPSEAVCHDEVPIQCPPTGYETHPHPSSCSNYYECNNGNAYESECAANTYFDTTPDLMQCNLAHLALCNAECPPVGIAFLEIRARDCKWYKVCVEGHSVNLECGGGEVYSPDESKCVPADAYMCPYSTEVEDE